MSGMTALACVERGGQISIHEADLASRHASAQPRAQVSEHLHAKVLFRMELLSRAATANYRCGLCGQQVVFRSCWGALPGGGGGGGGTYNLASGGGGGGGGKAPAEPSSLFQEVEKQLSHWGWNAGMKL